MGTVPRGSLGTVGSDWKLRAQVAGSQVWVPKHPGSTGLPNFIPHIKSQPIWKHKLEYKLTTTPLGHWDMTLAHKLLCNPLCNQPNTHRLGSPGPSSQALGWVALSWTGLAGSSSPGHGYHPGCGPSTVLAPP